MKLFEFTLPQKVLCEEKFLYYREMNDVHAICCHDENLLKLPQGCRVRFDTYFNVFSYSKYLKFTTVSKVSINLRLEGKFIIRLYKRYACLETCRNLSKRDEGGKIIYEEYTKQEEDSPCLIEEKTVSFNEAGEVVFCYDFSKEDREGNIFIELEAIDEGGVFYAGMYQKVLSDESIVDAFREEREERDIFKEETSQQDNLCKNQIKIGVVICTYNREEYVKRNIENIQKYFANKPSRSQVGVFVIDNGNTLGQGEMFEAKIVSNKNLGGSGGFTRGIIEVIQSGSDYTHFLLMDDDIVFDPMIIEKMISILKYAKNPESLCIGGTMMRVDIPYYQYEMGARWAGFMFESLKQGFDLRNYVDVLANECEEEMDYNAWWCMCMPVSTVEKRGLPLPFFIKGDDVEYGLRSAEQIMVVNGIGVWHENFKAKFSSELEYYFHRNQLIISAIHRERGPLKTCKKFIRSIARQLVLQRYSVVKIIISAYEDFLKGYRYFDELDGEKKHKELRNSGIKQLSKRELEEIGYIPQKLYQPKAVSKRKKILTLYGYFTPTMFYNREDRVGYRTVDMVYSTMDDFYKAKEVLQYNFYTDTGFVTKLKRWEFIKASCSIVRIVFKLLLQNKKVSKGYRENLAVLTDTNNWKRRLEIE